MDLGMGAGGGVREVNDSSSQISPLFKETNTLSLPSYKYYKYFNIRNPNQL